MMEYSQKERKCSEETRKKMSESHKGKKFTEEHKKKIGLSSRGRILSENARKKIREANIGKTLSIEVKQKISETQKKSGYYERNKIRMLNGGAKYAASFIKRETFEKKREWMLNGGSSYVNSFNKNPSKPQVKIFEIINELYPSSIMNYPFLNYSLDIAIPSLKIVIESDGSYWHKDEKYDLKRQKEIERKGWKFIRYKNINSIKDIPSIDKIKSDIELACKEIDING